MAVTSRWLDRVDGTEEMRLSLGQITYFDDRRVTLAGTGRKRDNSSDIIAEGLVNVTDELSFRGNVQWDPDGNEIQRSGVDLRYRPGLGRLVNVSYRFANDEEVEITREKLEEVDLTSLWTINEQWRAVARFNYSIVESQDLRIFGGFEYDQCCWALRVLARRSRDRPDEDADFSISFQVELKGLAGIGTDIPNLLEESIFGYEPRQRY
jgi:LPS-assembly protein